MVLIPIKKRRIYMKKKVNIMGAAGNRGLGANNLSMPSTRSTVLYNKSPQHWPAFSTVNINLT